MGFSEGTIKLDQENGTYYAGDTVQGKVIFDLEKVKNFRGIYVSITGACKVHWTTTHRRRVNDRHETYTKTHESYEEYLNQKIFLVGGSQGKHSLNPGNYEFPFTCVLPTSLPSSFEGSVGHIRYGVKAVVDRKFKFDQELFMPLNIIAPYDLNTNEYAKDPMEFELYQSYCCWCMNYGSSEVIVKVPASGFCVGQNIPIEVACTNNSRVQIDEIKFTIRREIVYHATMEPDTKSEESKVADLRKGPVPAGTTRNWTVAMEVPELAAYNLNACSFIDNHYEFKVEVGSSGCHEDSSETHQIYFGTIPVFGPNVTGPEENMQNVAAVNSPFLPPISNQASPFPNRSPYPGNANMPYPGNTTSPYPINPTGSPYPSNPPYPGNSPYPCNAPYPGNSPYPGNPPYPNVSPYPGPNPTVPTSSPYPPQSNMPYPGANPPYPSVSQGPVAMPPYPVVPNPAPYPASVPAGFTTPGKPEVTMTNPSDPFVSASAPPQ